MIIRKIDEILPMEYIVTETILPHTINVYYTTILEHIIHMFYVK